MLIRTLATAALVAVLALGAPLAAHAAVDHDSTLTGSTAHVDLDADPSSAGLKASVEILRVGAAYGSPVPADIVYINEYTLDGSGKVSFSATIPGGDLDDYVIAVKVAGASARYLASLDPAGPVPVLPPTTTPGGGSPSPGGAGGAAGGAAGPGDPLAFTGTTVAIGALSLLALAAIALGVILVLRRRRSRA